MRSAGPGRTQIGADLRGFPRRSSAPMSAQKVPIQKVAAQKLPAQKLPAATWSLRSCWRSTSRGYTL